MRIKTRFVVGGTLFVLTASLALGQQPPVVQPPPPVQQPPVVQPPPVGQQPPTVKQLPIPPGQSQGALGGIFHPAGQPGTYPGNYRQTPWFSSQVVQQHLNLTPAQAIQLNKTYQQSWNNYNMGLKGLDKLSDQQRDARMQELSNGFNKGLFDPAGKILNAQQMQRFNQLHVQAQGFGAFNNPEIQQKLNVTVDQQVKLRQFGDQYNQNLNAIYQSYATDPQGAAQRYDAFQRQNQGQLDSLLTPQQLQLWRAMSGDPYMFPLAPSQSK
jgi:hypothetical protein